MLSMISVARKKEKRYDNFMTPQYNTLLESILRDQSERSRKELLNELNGNTSPTLEDLREAVDRLTLRTLARAPKRRLKTPDLKFDTTNPSEEEIQAKLRAWSRDPFNWEDRDEK
jgi:hypothetical protein